MSCLEDKISQNQLRQQKVYLQMYLKGQQAARIEAEENVTTISKNFITISISAIFGFYPFLDFCLFFYFLFLAIIPPYKVQ